MKKTLTTRSPYAKMLENKIFRNRVIVPKKGKCSYNRKKTKIFA